jgi:cystatin-A/B
LQEKSIFEKKKKKKKKIAVVSECSSFFSVLAFFSLFYPCFIPHHAEEKAGAKFGSYELHSYATQVVAGTNFFLKINVGDGAFVHARVYRDLAQALSVSAVQTGKAEDDALEYFE